MLLMRRRLFTVLSVLSLVLCSATCVLWVRSYWVQDQWLYFRHSPAQAPEHRFSLLSHSGQFSISWVHAPLKPPDRYASRFVHLTERPPTQFWWKPTGGIIPAFWNRRGFALFDTDVHAPAWFPALLFAAAAILAARPWQLRGMRRKRTGRCPTCGYNLTGNTSGLCPECGTPTPPRQASERVARPKIPN
jgi:hypothetical protein